MLNQLDDRIEHNLHRTYDTLLQRGELLSLERLQQCYSNFRLQFGPDRLQTLKGEELLQGLHNFANRSSLVYWLEFKNDEEFSSPEFGSIAGGSAHKFGLFRRKETGQWVIGSSIKETSISEIEAIQIARKHRDQLLSGVSIFERLPSLADDTAYKILQEQLAQAAPDLSQLGWVHKYFCLLFPEKLDDYHNESYQRFNLIKLLQRPPQDHGVFASAGRYVELAQHFGWPLNHLTRVLNECNGRPIKYWRVGTRLGETDSIWTEMQQGGFIAIGRKAIGDLSPLIGGKDINLEIRSRLEQHYPTTSPPVMTKKMREFRNFLTEIKVGDIVLAADGETILGVGRVGGPYRFEPDSLNEAPHRHAVEWISTEHWKLPVTDGLRTTLCDLKKHEENLVEIERRILDSTSRPEPILVQSNPIQTLIRPLDGTAGRVEAILNRKGQVILFGPPGTGKTFWARKTALDLAALSCFKKYYQDLNDSEKLKVEGSGTEPGLVWSCTFHPAYGYEDFLEGFRPHTNQGGALVFQLRDGIFKRICLQARAHPDQKYFLIIDEINRGDIPRIFGELLTLLELDKRGVEVNLALSGDPFSVPKNLFVLGTMNTADRSIALLDTALRRRFGFVELMPDPVVFGQALVGNSLPLGLWVTALNDLVRSHLGRDARNLQIGHAYFLENGQPVTDLTRFTHILESDIIPLLEEYCYEDYAALTQILGEGLVDKVRQRIRTELFALNRQEELLQALRAMAPDIETSILAATPLDEIEPQTELLEVNEKEL